MILWNYRRLTRNDMYLMIDLFNTRNIVEKRTHVVSSCRLQKKTIHHKLIARVSVELLQLLLLVILLVILLLLPAFEDIAVRTDHGSHASDTGSGQDDTGLVVGESARFGTNRLFLLVRFGALGSLGSEGRLSVTGGLLIRFSALGSLGSVGRLTVTGGLLILCTS
jgi:hypothetical protein